MTTLGQLAERVLRKFHGGNIPSDSDVHRKEVQRNIIDACNRILKVRTVQENYGSQEYTPAPALIATYESVAVTAQEVPNQELVCVPIEEEGITSGTTTMTVTPLTASGTDYYNICINNITWGLTDATAVDAFISACNDSSAVEFVGLTSVPDTFLSVGIVNLSVTADTLCFDYFPENTPDSWVTADGNGWVTGDEFLWFIDTEGGSDFEVPTLIADHVAATHAILEALTEEQTYNSVIFTNINCCAVSTDASTIDSELTLPAIPILLPHGEGVWRVWGTNPNDPFIPVRPGEMARVVNITHTNLKAYLGNKTTYEWRDRNTLVFNQPVSTVGATVNLELLIVDPSRLAETDMLPLHPDQQDEVFDMVYQDLVERLMPDTVNDDKESRG